MVIYPSQLSVIRYATFGNTISIMRPIPVDLKPAIIWGPGKMKNLRQQLLSSSCILGIQRRFMAVNLGYQGHQTLLMVKLCTSNRGSHPNSVKSKTKPKRKG